MGYNTSMIVLNDALGCIEKDDEFGKHVSQAISQLGTPTRERGIGISSKGHCNAATVLETHHADQLSVVSFGGNCGQVLSNGIWSWKLNDGKEKSKVEILKRLADEMGYSLQKKPNKKT